MKKLLFCLCCLCVSITAQAGDAVYALPEIKVEGMSDARDVVDSLPAITHLSGNELERRKASTVGETLSREPGISSSFFGPNASRPIIRGLDGDRIRIMENGTGTLDASSASPDHAVSVDPLVMDAIDVIRGPSALLYGSNAIGGVINIKSKRIAGTDLLEPEAKLLASVSSVDRGRSFGFLGRQKWNHWIIEFDASGRGSENYEVPGFVRSERARVLNPLPANETEEKGIVQNSANRSYQGGIGATYWGEESHAGLSLTALQSQYGTVAEKDVLIDLQRFRVDAEAEKSYRSSFIKSARIKGAGTVYRHEEIESGEIGTTFRNQGGELRADFTQQKLGNLDGAFGLQAQQFRFSALGEEAFLPTTFNQSYAAFLFEQWTLGKWKPSGSARFEWSSVRADENLAFGPAETNSFSTASASAGIAYDVDAFTSTNFQLTYSERAPNYQELYASGAHLATGVFEQGNRDLNRERSLGAELFLKHSRDAEQLKSGVFLQNFSSFIALTPTGANVTRPETNETIPVNEFRSVSALLTGAEASWTHEWPLRVWGGKWDTEVQADFVRGLNRSDGGNLPRIPPVRESLSVHYKNKGWFAFAQVQRSEAQGLVAQNELATDAYVLANLGLEAPLSTNFGDYRLSLRVNNVTDTEARVQTSFLKEIAPLPGRNFLFSVQASL